MNKTMVILDNGETTKSKVKDAIFIQTAKNMMVNGSEIKSQVQELISIKMVTST